jgi:hypothetical protein
MKSKLSTDILSRGSDSLFMRVEEGRFSLCEWKGLYPEHVAQRFQKALFDEDIVVFPATSLKKYVPRIGLYSGSFDREALLRECRPMRRREAEEDRAVIQLVSVFVCSVPRRTPDLRDLALVDVDGDRTRPPRAGRLPDLLSPNKELVIAMTEPPNLCHQLSLFTRGL